MTRWEVLSLLRKPELVALCDWLKDNTESSIHPLSSCAKMRMSLCLVDREYLDTALEEVLGLAFWETESDEEEINEDLDDDEVEDEDVYDLSEDEPVIKVVSDPIEEEE